MYSTNFKYPDYDSNGNFVLYTKEIVWALDGLWNLDIRTSKFDKYLELT
jgi:hypothetical protein